VVDERLEGPQLEMVLGTLEELKSWLGDLHFLTGTHLSIEDSDLTEEGGHLKSSEVALNSSLFGHWEQGKALFVHEIGHSYFRKLTLTESEDFEEMVLEYDRYILASERTKKLLKEFGSNINASPEKLKEMSNQILLASEEEKKYAANGFMKMRAYDELFADLFVCLFMNDPNAISKQLSAPKEVKGRSFVSEIVAAEWSPMALINFEPAPIPHLHLSPSRNLIWEEAQSLLAQGHSPKDLLKKVFRAMVADFKKNGFAKPSMDFARANKSFSDEVRAVMGGPH